MSTHCLSRRNSKQEAGGNFLYPFFPLRNNSAITVNNVLILFVFICSCTVIPCLLELYIEVLFLAVGLPLFLKLRVTLHPRQLLA